MRLNVNWPIVELSELLKIPPSYGIVQPGRHVSSGVPIVRVGDISNGRVDASAPLCVDAEVEDRYRRTRLEGGEIVLSLVGSVGNAAVVANDLSGWNVARAVAVLRPKDPEFTRWIYYSLRSSTAQESMRNWQTTTVQATLNLRDVARIPISVPPPAVIGAATSVLGALDDKIAVNERIAATCDELRSLLFAEAISRDRARCDERPLSGVASFVNGRAFTKDANGTGRVVVRIAELNSGPGASTVYSDIEVPDRHLARSGDVLFAWSGSLRVARWFRSAAIVNQHIFKVIPHSGMPNWLVYELINLRMPEFRGIAADKATTMGHIQRKHLDDLVFVPNEDLSADLHGRLEPLWQRALTAEQESLALTELRDALLPKLMSGEIRVKDAERQVGEVV
ncbi:hypothetical protein Athai_46540 [Actinocatenispora thailandica]|uniref:Type I restriction modification DNA specificity domain-containing protein n=1 Tax=Actinocatenispora thailandica TaxID=227318 RepID=A0A7R7DSW9_9ACTN|nr:restriction endonuclease subunit S [Actinocatenispora thailandica]BCJ37151.1 hypothetical protein Athai_46540 [Actinocatenispora thailandica]